MNIPLHEQYSSGDTLLIQPSEMRRLLQRAAEAEDAARRLRAELAGARLDAEMEARNAREHDMARAGARVAALREFRKMLIADQHERHGAVLPDVHEVLDVLDELVGE